nr:hypothetical protein [Tanacetum cinerariifolium]
SCVENLVLNPSESKGENECDVPAGFTTFFNVLFDADYDFDSGDDQSTSDEDFLKKINPNPLFDEEINPMKIDQHPLNAESDLIESMPNHDSSITISSKVDSLFNEFASELTLLKSIPPGIDETDCHPEEEIRLTKRLFDSHMDEIDLPFTPDDPMPPGIEDDDYDSGRDTPILEELLDNYSLSLPANESYHYDIPLPYRPPAKSPDGKTETLNIKMLGDVSDQKNSFDYPPDSYHPPHPIYETYSGDTCGNNYHLGYDCPPQFPLNYEPEPGYIQNYNSYPHDSPSFPQQYPCCEDCGVTHEPYQCQPKNYDYYHEQNSCYDSNSIGFDQFQPQQYTVNHPIFSVHHDVLGSQKKLNITLTKLPVCYDDDDDEKSSNSLEDNIISELQSYSAVIPSEPIDSLSMGDEHLGTVPAIESGEFIKSCVENLVPNPSESKGENECDVPAGFTTFSNVLFDADYDFDSGDDQSTSDEDFPKKIYSNPLFDEEINPMKIDQHPLNAESDLIESMPNHDSSITISSKVDSLFDEFASELTLLKSIPPGIDETDRHPEEEIHLTKRLFDSHIEEIDLPFTLDDPMPPGIKDDDYDSGRDILILEELLDNYSLSLPANESYHFDIPSPYRPPAKPPDGGCSSFPFLSHLINSSMGELGQAQRPKTSASWEAPHAYQ